MPNADVVLEDRHAWEAITIERVHILLDDDGDPVAFSDPDEPGETRYGCGVCGQPVEAADAQCPGWPNDDEF